MGALMQISIFVVLIGIAALFLYRYGKRADDQRKARFTERDELGFDDFVNLYYKDASLDQVRLRRALEEVSQAVQVPAGKLRPTDRFDVELAPPKGWELDDGTALLRQFIAKKDTAGKKPISTLDEYLRARSS